MSSTPDTTVKQLRREAERLRALVDKKKLAIEQAKLTRDLSLLNRELELDKTERDVTSLVKHQTDFFRGTGLSITQAEQDFELEKLKRGAGARAGGAGVGGQAGAPSAGAPEERAAGEEMITIRGVAVTPRALQPATSETISDEIAKITEQVTSAGDTIVDVFLTGTSQPMITLKEGQYFIPIAEELPAGQGALRGPTAGWVLVQSSPAKLAQARELAARREARA